MTRRRTLDQACQLTPDQQAFIGKTPTGQNRTESSKSDNDSATTQAIMADHPATLKKTLSQSDRFSVIQTPLVPLTTRLRPQTAEGLGRAYLRQKLNNQSPSTQQEIVEEAICQWL